MQQIIKLNMQFGITDQLTFETGEGNRVFIHVVNEFADAHLSLQGAQLLSWKPRFCSDDVIWVSEKAVYSGGRSIRGGIPVCWPWFGAHPTEETFPAHGFARGQSWKMVETKALPDGRTFLALRLSQETISSEYKINGADLELQIIIGEKLEMSMVTMNSSEKQITIGGAFHTYFNVSDIQNVLIQGLEGQTFIDTLDDWQRKKEDGSIRISGEIDRIYYDSPDIESIIEDKGLGRRIKVKKKGSHSTVVWNPWIDKSERMGDMGIDGYRTMVCVETTNAADDVLTIEPGGEHRLAVCYEVESL